MMYQPGSDLNILNRGSMLSAAGAFGLESIDDILEDLAQALRSID